MKRVCLVMAVIMLLPLLVFAGYSSYMKEANELYKNGNYQEALELYKLAFQEKPSENLSIFMEKLENKINQAQQQTPPPIPLPGKKDDTLKNCTLVLNGLSIGFATYAIIDYMGSLDFYKQIHEKIDNTTEENYQRLNDELAYVDGKGLVAMISGVAAGLIVSYTLTDMMILHNIFTEDSKVELGFDKQKVMLSYNIAY